MVGLQVKVGLSVDHELFDSALLKKATEMILKTRDGKQWFAVAKPLGTCAFINDASDEELDSVLQQHKQYIREKFPHLKNGAGQDATLDASDMGCSPESFAALVEAQAKGASIEASKLKVQTNGEETPAVSAPTESNVAA